MSMYFPNMPRDFSYQNKPQQNYPLELTGSSVRVDAQKSTRGEWGSLINKTDDFQICTNPYGKENTRRASEYRNGARVLQPDLNIENNKIQSKKIINKQQNNDLVYLMNKGTDQYQEKGLFNQQYYPPQANIESNQAPIRRAVKRCPLKDNDYFSQIQSLPGTAFHHIEEDEDDTHITTSMAIKQAQDMQSQITNIPGSHRGKEEEIKVHKSSVSEVIRFTATTDEMTRIKNIPEKYHKPKLPSENDKHCNEEFEFDIKNHKSHVKHIAKKQQEQLQSSPPQNNKFKSGCLSGCRKKAAENSKNQFLNHFTFG